MGSRRGGAGKSPIPAFATLFSAASNDLRFDGTSFTQSAGNLVALVDRISGTRVLNVSAGTVAQPAVNAGFNNAPTISFTGTQSLDSGDTAAFWSFLSDTTQCEWFCGFRMTSTSLGVILSTGAASTSNIGFQFYANAGTTQLDMANNATVVASATQSSPAGLNGRASYTNFTFGDSLSPRYVSYDRSTQTVSSSAGSAAGTPPQATMRVGGQVATGLYRPSMDLAFLWFFHRRLTAAERTSCRNEALATFGVPLT